MKALAYFVLIIGTFARVAESNLQSDIECLRSIKESLQDPLNILSSWKFNSQGKRDDFLCGFHGVDCWGGGENWIVKIRLSGMGLSGEFPRGIANCTFLTNLDLSRNQLYGSIPSDIWSSFGYLTSIDLSFNRFSGEIPSGIADCSYLNVLNLNDNFLTGHIPAGLGKMQRLSYFSVANNVLEGAVPRFGYSNFPPESYMNNSGLCGEPLDPCPSSVWKTAFIDGLLVSWAVFFVLSSILGFFVPPEKFAMKFRKRNRMTTPIPQLLSLGNRGDHKTNKILMLEKFLPHMSFLELSKATGNFSRDYVIARGESGTTYKAVLTNGCCLAVKKLHPLHLEQEFLAEITTLGRMKHKNIVPLVGFCYELTERMVIYKFVPIGSLYDFLFPSNDKSMVLLEWPVKVKIAVEVAKGIAWLHQNGVTHRAITSKCILLDQNLDPKISDFGSATPLTQYLDKYCSNDGKEYSWNREFPEPGSYVEDVRGFGVVLLELITRKKHNYEIDSFNRTDGHLAELELEYKNDGTTSHLLRIARRCLECELGGSPSMLEVCRMLVVLET